MNVSLAISWGISASTKCTQLMTPGFKGLKNGRLLTAATGIYDILITVDQNIPYQQNIQGLQIAVVVLVAKRNSYVRLKPLLPRALAAIEVIQPGQVITIS